ncbi:hypothetical protein EXE58_06165 [Nocardioides seonyuensis]|uniref:Uncharacterized protein n=1 Tax=Nocardioides seonyuensis TaxID=2518371 RepID=A0A4P7ID66_9ACTN|nr:GerMN domain-containing protein [Nocardioides seonyuensis]QBX55079.1 hypothetical protein EXE58_06165 [Nocardioides seonyuensis]
MDSFRLACAAFLVAGALAPAAAPGGAAAPESLPQLVDVRTVHRAGVDRVIFQFDSGVPSTSNARYVRRLRGDGSGLPIRIAGQAVLQVSMHTTETSAVGTAPVRRAFSSPNVMNVVRSGLFEGVTSYGIGLARKTTYDVVEQPGRSRVVVAVRAAFPTVDRKVYFLDEDRFVDNREPFFVPRRRRVPLTTPATGVMDRVFAGPTRRERRQGLRLVRSGAKSYEGLTVSGGVARVRLRGGCDSGGSTVTVAGSITPSLRQFDGVEWVKILPPGGGIPAGAVGPGDYFPDCLNP